MELLAIISLLTCLLAYSLYNGYGLLRDLRPARGVSTQQATPTADRPPPKPLSRDDIVRSAAELREKGWTVELADDHLSLLAHKPLDLGRAQT